MKTDGGLRHEISNGAVNDQLSGYNEMAVKQELYSAHDGKPVPGRNKLPDLGFDGTGDMDYALHHAPPGLDDLGAEFVNAADGAVDDIIEHGAKEFGGKKVWKNLAPEVAVVERGWMKVLGAINKSWDLVWDTIFWPVRQLVKLAKGLLAQIGKWFGIVVKHVGNGAGVFAKIARGFEKVFTAVRATKAWELLKWGPKLYELYITKVGPWVLKNGAKWLGKVVSAVGWATLLLDLLDVAQMTECLMRVNKEGNGPELPKYCDGTVTKLIMGWMGHKMNAAAGHHEES